LRRKNPKNRGFKIIKTQPPRGLTFFPKDLLIHFGETIEIETAPITPVGIFFQYGLSVDEVVHALNLIIDSVKLQEAHNKIIPKE